MTNQTPIFIPPGRVGQPSKYREEMKEWALEAGAMGASISGIWAYFYTVKGVKLGYETFRGWITKTDKEFRPDFYQAVQDAQNLALARFEQIGQDAAAGLIPKHAQGTYQFLVKNRFRRNYRDETVQKIEKRSTVTIDPSAPPQLAAKQYQDLIAESAVEETFEDFFDIGD